MNEPAEALAQLARLLGDEKLRSASPEDAQAAAADETLLLAAGLVTECAASDDVFDRESALGYIDQRLRALASVISPTSQGQIRHLAREQIENW